MLYQGRNAFRAWPRVESAVILTTYIFQGFAVLLAIASLVIVELELRTFNRAWIMVACGILIMINVGVFIFVAMVRAAIE